MVTLRGATQSVVSGGRNDKKRLKEFPSGVVFLHQRFVVFQDFSFDLLLQSLLVSLVLLLKFLEHLVLNLGQPNGGIHLTTSLRLFWNHS
jgi:hypothetical protein